jgi:periplasmic copper chaperone A
MASNAVRGWVAMLVVGLLAAGGPPVSGHELTVKHLTILHPYTIEPVERLPHEVTVYMVIGNSAAAADRLIGVESQQASSASLVARSAADGTAQSVAAIELPANAQTVLGPKSAHVLLRDLKETIEGYQYFPLTLVFEKAGLVEIEVYVEDHD